MNGSTVADRIIRRELKRRGMSESELPPQLRDRVIHRTRKGPLGQLVVRSVTGVENNRAAQIVRQFEENTGGKDDIIEKMEAVRETLSKPQLELLELLKTNTKKKLPRLMAECKVELGSLMKSYTQGALSLGQTAAIAIAAQNLPRVAKDLAAHALDGTGSCSVCVGSGKVPARKGETKDTIECPGCHGSGTVMVSSKHKEFAVQKILEMGKMIEGKGGPIVNVNQQVGIKVGSVGATMEKMALLADEILHGRTASNPEPEITDAEVVPVG